MNIEERIQGMSGDELERLLKCLNFTLSGSECGESQAFKFLAEIEAIAIKEKDTRNSGWIPDEATGGLHRIGGHYINGRRNESRLC